MIQPKPFTIKCPKCNWSKRIYPKSDAIDTSWGLVEYAKCPKCGEPTTRSYQNGIISDAIGRVKRLLG